MKELDLSDCYHPSGTRQFDRNSVDGLRKSLNHAHTVNQALIRTADRQEKRLARQGLKLWILGIAASGAWALIVALIAVVLERK